MAAPQDSLSPEETQKLAHVAKSLCASDFLASKNQNIRILTACCLADILRLFAPETPFNEVELKVRCIIWAISSGQVSHGIFS
jgi:hypothetical protein